MENWNKFFPKLIKMFYRRRFFCSGYKVPLKNVLLTTAWCVESRVSVPDSVHSWLGRMQDSVDRTCFRHISTRGGGFGWFVPASAGMSRISWTSDPTRCEWGTLAAVENNLVPAATRCIRLVRQHWHDVSGSFEKTTLSTQYILLHAYIYAVTLVEFDKYWIWDKQTRDRNEDYLLTWHTKLKATQF